MAKTKETKTPKPRCGLCGKTRNLIRTECCGNWICNDEDKYVLFSYARNSCHRNHRRYTMCAFHHNEGHKGDWKTCKKCRSGFEPEMAAWYGTNEYNFEKLSDPPPFEPKQCARCGGDISLAAGGYSHGSAGYTCEACLGGPPVRPGRVRILMPEGRKVARGKPKQK